MFKADAIDLCKAHGGYLFAPRNEEENAEVLERMNPFLSSCLDESSENIAWLGASVLNSTFHIIDENNNLVKSNFSKLDKEMFEPEMNCVSLRKDGIWETYSECTIEKSCVVCGFVDTPVFTLKGMKKRIR